MIRSMTGFGRGEAQAGRYRFLVECKAVNHRFLNLSFRLPREYAHLEALLTTRCTTRCERGHLSVTLAIEAAGDGDGRGPRLNRPVLDRLLTLVEDLAVQPGVNGGVSAGALLALPGVLEWEPERVELDDGGFLAGALPALDAALDALTASRDVEGRALDQDFRARLTLLGTCHGTLAVQAPAREARERDRLRAKVAALLTADGAAPDGVMDQRVAQEIVLYADRVDVSEELTRFGAHLDHFRAELDADGGAVGRKLTFLLQELHREANTIGAKANDPDMQQVAIVIKTELEKIREQAENVE